MYINGGDILLNLGTGAPGHSSSHKTTYTSETKEHATKPAASVARGSGKFKEKSVVAQSASISVDGLIYSGEQELGHAALLTAWANGVAIEVKAYYRGNTDKPYMTGSFIITQLEETAGMNDDFSYSLSLESTGKVTITEANADFATPDEA